MRSLWLLVLCLTWGSPAAAAFPNTQSRALVALHLGPKLSKNVCSGAPTEFHCDIYDSDNLNINGTAGINYHVFIVLLDIDPEFGVESVTLAMSHDFERGMGMDTFGVTSCADFDYMPDPWPAPGQSATFVWTTCQNTVDPSDPQGEAATVAAAIYAYAYGTDIACVEPDSELVFEVSDCDGVVTDLLPDFPSNRGCVGFDRPGQSPCMNRSSPVRETVWSAVKRMYYLESPTTPR